jgi:hypothetical protein
MVTVLVSIMDANMEDVPKYSFDMKKFSFALHELDCSMRHKAGELAALNFGGQSDGAVVRDYFPDDWTGYVDVKFITCEPNSNVVASERTFSFSVSERQHIGGGTFRRWIAGV